MGHGWSVVRHCLSGLCAGLGLLSLAGCSDGSAQTPTAAQADGSPPECRAVMADGRLLGAPDPEELRNYSLASYRQFPSEVRALMRRADFEHGGCRGGLGDRPETFRACNRRDCVMLELERSGWCHGGGEFSAQDRWMRCSHIAGFTPTDRQVSFPEEEIRRMFPPRATDLDVAFSNAEGHFFDEVGDALPPNNPLARLRRDVEARLAACGDPECSRQIEADLINRLRFALGEAIDPVPAIPLRTGHLSVDGNPASRDVRVLPMDDDRILVKIAPPPTESLATRCRGLVAEGHLGPGGIARLTSIDNPSFRFDLHVVSPTRIELRPIEGGGEFPAGRCGLDGTIFSHYEAVPPLL